MFIINTNVLVFCLKLNFTYFYQQNEKVEGTIQRIISQVVWFFKKIEILCLPFCAQTKDEPEKYVYLSVIRFVLLFLIGVPHFIGFCFYSNRIVLNTERQLFTRCHSLG